MPRPMKQRSRLALNIPTRRLESFAKQKRTFRGAIALEQRPKSAPSYECNSAQKTSNMTKKEEKMMEKNTSDAPTWLLSRTNAFLAALHVLVLAVSMMVHPPVEFGANRALP